MNLRDVRKRVLVRTGVMLGIVAVLGGVAGGMTIFGSQRIEAQAKAKAQLDQTNMQARELQSKIVRARESFNLYQAINNRGKRSGLSLDREYAKRLLDEMKAQYHLSTLSITVSPVTNEPGGTGNTQLISSHVTVTMEGFTDELLIAFVNAIKLRFPGYVRIERFDLVRNAEVTRDVLVNVAKGELAPLVRGEAEFKWLGVKPVEAAAALGTPAPTPAPGAGPIPGAIPASLPAVAAGAP